MCDTCRKQRVNAMMCLLAAVGSGVGKRHGYTNEELAAPLAAFGGVYRKMMLDNPLGTEEEKDRAAEVGSREMREALRDSPALLLDSLRDMVTDLVFVADSFDSALKDVILEKFDAGDRTMTERTVRDIGDAKEIINNLRSLFGEEGQSYPNPNERSVLMPGSPPGVVS